MFWRGKRGCGAKDERVGDAGRCRIGIIGTSDDRHDCTHPLENRDARRRDDI